MFEAFTDFARQCVVGAVKEADTLEHPIVGSEHLLLSLAKLPGLASIVLSRHGVSPNVIAAEVAERTHFVPEKEALAAIGIDLNELVRSAEAQFGPGALSAKPQITELLQAIFEQAHRESENLGSTYDGRVFVGTEHLLLGLVRQGEGVGCDILTDRGVDLRGLREELGGLLRLCVELRATIDRQPTERTARRLLQMFQQLPAAERDDVTPVVRDMVQAQRAAWARVLEEMGQSPTESLVTDYVSTVRPVVSRAEGALMDLPR